MFDVAPEALAVAVLVVLAAVATNMLSGAIGDTPWKRLATRRGGHALAVIGVATVAVAAAVSAELVDDESEAFRSARSSFMWDADGLRPGIAYRDEFTPWADQPAFNSVIGHRTGDERRFVKGAVVGRDAAWQSRLDVTPGDRIQVKVSVSNEAEPMLNDTPDRRGVATGTRVAIAFSDVPSTGPLLFATVAADNASPRWVAARLQLRSSRHVALVPAGSAQQLHDGRVTSELPDPFRAAARSDSSSVARTGVLVGESEPNGVVLAGWDHAVEVVATFEVEAP